MLSLEAELDGLAGRLFGALREMSFDGVGITRECFTDTETAALRLIEAEARRLGLETEWDAGANLWATLPGREPELPAIACGSHLDSVPQGGNFDGAAGVIAGLLALGRLKAEGFAPRRSLRLLALRGEESAFYGQAYLGSSALFGRLGPADLAAVNVARPQSLGEAMAATGIDTGRVARGEALIDPAGLAAWLELHIEQGPVLVARRMPAAVVTGIRGNLRHRAVECLGEAGHSGAVPRWLRHDTVFAVAELITRLDRHWRTLLERGRDLVVTAGILGTDPAEHALARIPGRVTFSLDIRSQSRETLEAFYDLFLSECAGIAEERGVRFDPGRRLEAAPARMDEALVGLLREELRGMGQPDEPIPSGAGHDAAVFAQAGVPSAMIFVRNANGSHNPREAMEMEDFHVGAELLRRGLARLAA
ncbi:Zn-dependent hydrolase [Pseudoroseomonas rhizosphaerae]|uniref:Zn-dependent hydrolase n=1 Tax=Teichococcus rhizosphaerae TaxID=1335062 RepID=A0A2C7AEM7_9PROT|nr:Zn-dependent hydrolase [Pseudoroseomonas rhizosphaerae]PHK95586.1 Zn-dependent hydrolase [Pseudoroseomonas rhizosphaerae]